MKKILLILFVGIATHVSAQLNVDSLLEVGKQNAYGGKYELALPIFNLIIGETPEYYDAYMLKARTFAWDGKYDKSLTFLQLIKNSFPENIEPRVFEATVLFWSEKYDESLGKCNEVLADSAVEETRYLKARLLYFNEEFKPALNVIDSLVEDYPDNKDYKKLQIELTNLLSADHIGIWGTYDQFTNFSGNPRLGLSIEAKKVFKLSPVIGRVNFADRFNLNDYQVEIEAYPRPLTNLYFYLNASYSPNGIWFPEWRYSADIYFGLPKGFEVSAGFRYIEFTSITFQMLTFYAGYYPGNNYIYARLYKGASNFGGADIFELVGRRYLTNQYHYFELRGGVGNSPDVNTINNVFSDTYSGQIEQAWNIGVGYQQPIIGKWHGRAWFIYNNQKPETIKPYEILSYNLGVWWRF